jgi:exonuclease III
LVKDVERNTKSIALKYRDVQSQTSSLPTKNKPYSETTAESIHTTCTRRTPVIRNQDFFMVEMNTHKEKESNVVTKEDSSRNHDLSFNVSKSYQRKKDSFVILRQNICGIQNKRDELLLSLYPNPPHNIFLSEHHLKNDEIETLTLNQHILGAKFCRQSYKGGGVCIHIQESITFCNINLHKYSKDDFEICAVKINSSVNTIIIMTIYRYPDDDFQYFLNRLECTLNRIHNNTTDIIICGDFNINYLHECSTKQLLNSLLASYSLYSTIQFPTRIQENSHTLIDNIFINTYRHEEFTVYPLVNGLSDHDAQVISMSSIPMFDSGKLYYYNRKFDKYSINEFKLQLSYERIYQQ